VIVISYKDSTDEA